MSEQASSLVAGIHTVVSRHEVICPKSGKIESIQENRRTQWCDHCKTDIDEDFEEWNDEFGDNRPVHADLPNGLIHCPDYGYTTKIVVASGGIPICGLCSWLLF